MSAVPLGTDSTRDGKGRAALLRGIAPALFTLALAGCAQFQAYRVSTDGYKTCEYRAVGDCPTAALISHPAPMSYGMGVVEIDEQGFFADRAQAEAVVAMASAKAERGRSYVVVFVHGWHHNAGPEDENLEKFHDALRMLSGWRPNDTVRGIYVGWRGDSLAVKGLRYLTFWDRKNTSDEVGRGSFYEFLMRLERGVKGADPGNRLVLIGHSFGASVSFNALAQLYMQRFIDGLYSTSDGPRFRGYGDLAVMINPAIEGMRYMPFHSALQYYGGASAPLRADFSHEKRPALLVLSSEGDWATRITFPAARFFTTMLEAHNTAGIRGSGPDIGGGYSEWVMDVQTLGNFGHFHTHESLGIEQAGAKPLLQCPRLEPGRLARILNDSKAAPQTFPDSGIVLKHRGEPPTASPYWSANMSADIVAGHTDIAKPSLVCWIIQLVDAE